VIVGARAPVLIPSRAEQAEDKLLSIALGVLASGDEP
jgi:phosphate butyryltransferase